MPSVGFIATVPHAVFAEMLFDFGDHIDLLDSDAALRDNANRVVDLG
jgi:hypothetical protein